MTTKRTLEEIAERTAENFECSRQLHLSESDREVFLLNVESALREAADAARQDERDALRDEVSELMGGGPGGVLISGEYLIAWLNTRSRSTEQGP